MKIYFNYIYFYNVAYSLHMSDQSLVSRYQEEKVRPVCPGGLFLLIIQLMINYVKYFLLFANNQENSRNDQCGSQPKSPGNLLTQK